MKSELTDYKSRNKVNCNISKELIVALKSLIKMQKDRKIIIKRCNKGAGIIILNFDEYVCAANVHLNSTLRNTDGSISNYYIKVNK